ncbi:MAG: hypothetical protein SFW08_08930 [Gemmatimonadaceae bacterium]|nr:hypothetical protein [Gemmatimonadaceae bacterium]
MMVRRWARLAVLCAGRIATAAPLLAQSPTSLLDADPLAADSLRRVLARAEAAAVPLEPLTLKVREGLAKQAPPLRIVDATARLAERLRLARTALAPTTGTDEIAAGADALYVGVQPLLLQDLRRRFPARSLTIPLGVLTQLVASGVSASRAGALVRELLDRGASAPQLIALSTEVQRDVGAGLSPSVAIALRSGGLLSTLPAASANSGGGVLPGGVTTGGGRPPTPRP